jgi:hypothetical protein
MLHVFFLPCSNLLSLRTFSSAVPFVVLILALGFDLNLLLIVTNSNRILWCWALWMVMNLFLILVELMDSSGLVMNPNWWWWICDERCCNWNWNFWNFLQVKMNVHALFILFLSFLVLWSENAEREKVQSVCDDVERNEWWFLTLTVELAFIADCVTAWTNNKLPCGAGPCNKLLDRWTNEKLTHVQTWWLGQKGLKYNF